ncbi:MAG: hypothetical protein JWM68_4756 [Verrucomicrobiales bacterium]|nr:hypothetical protein [Verrucomicrobiales bacterium]
MKLRADIVDPHISSWITNYSGKYARLFQTDAQLAGGLSKTTWTNGSLSQSLPVYSGVQEIYSSSNWVYVRSTGLGSHTMGPWYNDATRTTLFVNIAVNQRVLFRIPRIPTVPSTKVTVGGDIGYFVDGVDGFDSRDAVSYINSTGVDGNPPGGAGSSGDGVWNRDAYKNEAVTFDPALAHQQDTGVYHYHANPIATRYLLGDHVAFTAGITNGYIERTNAPTQHSPIVGWAKDGFPIYGPYGYSVSNDASSGIRRMVSGFVLRNGQYGTTNLASTGRTTLPAWAARAGNRSATLVSTSYGPAVSTSFPLGRYTEDNDYLGDLGFVQGTNTFDLDEYNGRICITPEFPTGTYAYFVTITSNGLPTYPYNLGKQYYGNPTGSTIQTISETVTTNFLGGTNIMARLSTPTVAPSTVTLLWSAVEGGTYRVETSSTLTNWTPKATNVAQGISLQTNITRGSTPEFYRVARTAVASFDNAGTNVFSTPGFAPGGSASRGSTVTLLITLTAPPTLPPANAMPASITLGSIAGTGISHPSTNMVQATFVIPANASTGSQNVIVTFSPGPTYTLTGGFTIN